MLKWVLLALALVLLLVLLSPVRLRVSYHSEAGGSALVRFLFFRFGMDFGGSDAPQKQKKSKKPLSL